MMRPEGTCGRDFSGQSAVSNRTVSQFSDAVLLRHYVTDGNEWAFTELVHRYQRLVLGASYRRSGDLELARDVAQQVFAALARKANLLADRKSLAGWLYQATMYETYRSLQSEGRRRTRHELIALDQPEPALNSPAEIGAWAALDEAIDRLPSADGEALAMHYFQDLSYHEMAVVLRVNEAAVRKRVSRALQRLGENLRESGLKQSAAALLAGAVAIQNGIAVPANLAQAALALAAAGGGGSAFLTLTAAVSKGLVKAAAIIVTAALAWFVWQRSSPERKSERVLANSANVAAGNASAPAASFADTPGTNGQAAFENQTEELSRGPSQGSRSIPVRSKAVAATRRWIHRQWIQRAISHAGIPWSPRR